MGSRTYCPVVPKSNLVLHGDVSHLQHLVGELRNSLVVIFELQRIISEFRLYWAVRFANDNFSLLQTNELVSFNDLFTHIIDPFLQLVKFQLKAV